MERSRFTVKIWGGRGSIPTPGLAMSEYGGNSSCVEMRCGDRIVILDAGTGIRELGFDLQERNVTDFDLLFGHFHYDHIMGLPFFIPLHDCNTKARIWSGHLHGATSTQDAIYDFMRTPFFPVQPDIFAASIDYRDFNPGDRLDLGDGISAETVHLTHPGGCTGYRIDFDGRSAVYVSDHEHLPGVENENVLRLIDQADLVIYDATYTDNELPEFTGYGHSTWQEGVRLCKKAGARQLVLFHHRPRRTDNDLRAIEDEARAEFPGTVAARDHMEFDL